MIYIGDKILSNHDMLLSHIHGKQVLIVTQENIARWYLKNLREILADFQCEVIYLPEGERYKNIDEWQKIMTTLIENKHERSTTLIALGGGMVGDMTGFAAACYLRGVNYIQIPTTLIGQVDAAIGGKTGMNHSLGKNLIGAFHQPQCVIADVDTIMTLSDREFFSGLAEVVKYGLICDSEFFQWLENNITDILARKVEALLHIVSHCSTIKSNLVKLDEKDHGQRRLLNFGHTFGHAIETLCGILHGEAVAIGMLLAAQVSENLGWLTQQDVQRIKNLLLQFHLKLDTTLLPSMAELMLQMQHDKKIKNGKLTLILLKAIGKAEVVDSVDLGSFAL